MLDLTPEELDDVLTDGMVVPGLSSVRCDHANAHPGATDLVTVAYLRQQAAGLEAAYDTAPSAALLPDAGQCLGQVRYLRQHARTAVVRHELTRAECEAAVLLGKLVWDASGRPDQVTPSVLLDQAIAAARQLGDTAAEGRALLRKSYVALYGSRDPRAGRRLARAAAATTRRASDALAGLATAHAAEASAMLGDRRDCELSLSRAEKYVSHAGDHDAAADSLTPARYDRLAGSCYLFLRDDRRAQEILQAAAGQLTGHQKSRAIVLGNLSLACVRQRKLDEAVIYLGEAIDVVEQTWGGGGLTVVFAAGRELRP